MIAYLQRSFSPETIGEGLILLAAILFALAFILRKAAMNDGIDPIVYNFYRYFVATSVTVALKYILKVEVKPESDQTDDVQSDNTPFSFCVRNIVLAGCFLGIANFGGAILQQIGLVTVSAGKTAFISGMYVVFVPIAEVFFACIPRSFSLQTWLAALISITGLYLLSGCAEADVCIGGAIQKGEMLIFLGMLSVTISIMLSDIGTKRYEVIELVIIEFSTCTILNFIVAWFATSSGSFTGFSVQANAWQIILVGIVEATSFVISSIGQRYVTSARAALLYSIEAIVTVIFAYFTLGETLTPFAMIGGGLMTMAACISGSSTSDSEMDFSRQNSSIHEDRYEQGNFTPPQYHQQQPRHSSSSYYRQQQQQQQQRQYIEYHSPLLHETLTPILKQNNSFGSVELISKISDSP
jgi:drug/metabolite transporter (DMT)-like permease